MLLSLGGLAVLNETNDNLLNIEAVHTQPHQYQFHVWETAETLGDPSTL